MIFYVFPGDQPNLISVGATTQSDIMASFSSRGPSLVGMRLKPEFAAPGDYIESCGKNFMDYVTMSGTEDMTNI